MYDHNRNNSFDIKYHINELKKDCYQLTITPNNEWLEKAEYPVTIDPSLNSSTTSLSIHDTYISRQNPTQSYSGDSIMRLSSDSLFYDVNYGLFSFNIPSSVMSKTITYSRLTFNSSFSFMNAQIDLYKNESFFGDSITWNAWNDWDFKHEPYPVDYHIYDGSNQVIFDITKPVKEWQATGNTSTPGFTLKSSSDLTELYTVDYPVAESKPLITIGYEEPAGLKDYWTYTSQDLGMVGTGYVTDYTGNLTFVRNDFHFENELMPLSLSFYFNTSGRSNNIGYGSGWKTNYYMKLQYTTTLKYSLYKPDGNNVYFQNEIYDSVTGTYKSIAEDGSGMTLIRTSNSWKIQTKSNIEYTFDSDGRLIVITDLKTEHHLNVHYVPDLVFNTIWDKIDYVNDEIGNKIQFFYNTQFFKPLQVDLILDCKSVELQLVTEMPSVYRTVESRQFYYDSYKNINYITQGFNYGTESSMIVNDYTLQYTFSSSHLLLDAYNENDNYKVTYQYDNINRVDNIEYTDIENGSEVSLGYTSIEYIPTNQTIYTDYKLNSIKYTFDNWGHTINIIDSFGNATFYKYSNPYSGVMNSEYPYVFDIVNAEPDYINTNKLLESSEPLKQQQNYVKNSGFENYLHCWLTGPNGIVNYNSLEKVLGHYSLTVTNELESGSYAYQDVILDTGVYSIQGWIKNNSSTGGASISIISADTIISSKNPINGSDDWQHFELRFKIDSPKTVSIHLLNTSISTAYFDNIQLLEGWYDEEINEFYGTNFIDTRYNILTDNSFEESSSLWSLSNAGVSTIIVPISTPNDTMNKILGGNAVRIIGDSQTYNFASQTVMLYTPNGNNSTIIVGGWARAYSAVPNKGYADGIIDSDDRFFGLEVTVQVDYNAYETYYLPFDPSVRDWQYQMKSITLPEFTFLNGTIQIKGVFQGEGEAYFDNFQVYVDKITTEYSYNDRGNLDTVTEPSGKQTTFEYVESSDQIESITTNDITTGINYGDDLLVDSVIRDNVRVGFHYNEENQVDITTYGIPYGSTITTSTTYTDDFQYIESEKDEFGNEIHYTTNQSISAITEIIDALGTSQELHYDAYGNLSSTSMTADGITIGCSYTYNPDNGKLEEINRNGLIYEVVYDELDRIESLMIAGNTIVSNTYNDDYGYETNLIENQNYANGYGIQFIYDDEDRIHQVKEKNGENDYTIRFVYEYDSSGRLSILKDCNDFASDNYNNIYYYSYDLTGRITNIIDQNSNIISYGYDSQGHVNEYHYIVGDVDNEVYYNYDSTGQYQDTVFNSGSVNYHFDTDELKRLDNIEFLFSSGSVKKVFDYEICYDLGDSNRVSYMYYYQKYSTEENDIYNCKKSWHFQYDSNNNITDIDMNCYDSLSPYTTHKEHYDYRYNGFNEIIRENYDDGTTSFTKVFTYDGNGNIETMKTYEYSTSDTIDENTLLESIEFDYISDRITQITVNGVVNDAFTYDEIGNLLTDGTNSYTWNGKELTQIETSTGTYNYLYNDQGIRTQKEKVNGEITKYYLDGNKVLVETNGTDTIYYTYNFDGSLISMNLNGTEYFYVTNLQGDIIELVAEDGTTVVSYKYDAWGNIVGTPFDISNVDLANKNPYRYRGYHYDNETSLYYCNSRYYNPEIGRWLNADDVSYLDPSSVNGLNLYSYCGNNPVMYVDPEGNFPWLILAAVLLFTPVGGTALQVVTSVVSYAGMAVASIFDEDIRKDMNAIGWNPFNTEESATLNSSKVSFYKGVPVFRTSSGGRSGSFGAIFLTKGSVVDDLRHERGHNWQLMMMGIGTYGFTVGIPSPLKLGPWDKSGKYYYAPWETMADILGGVTHRYGMPIPQRQITNAWMYYGISTLCFPFTALYWL